MNFVSDATDSRRSMRRARLSEVQLAASDSDDQLSVTEAAETLVSRMRQQAGGLNHCIKVDLAQGLEKHKNGSEPVHK
jgi:hypothetical protein